MKDPLSPKQLEFLIHSTKRWNIAHGAMSTGKTVCTAFRFFQAVEQCPDSEIAMIGKTSTTIFNNVINLVFESKELNIFRPFCTWYPSRRELRFKDKTITTYGAKDEGSAGLVQGRTLSLVYCDEMTLYPDSFIYMLDTRLRKEYSMGFASMNPSHPYHIIKGWIDDSEKKKSNYYALHFTLDDNPFLPEEYKLQIKNSLSGLFYKRNYLGLWCMAEGAIFDFFDKKLHVVEKPPRSAEYYIAAIDYGSSNAFCCLLIGINSGKYIQEGKHWWVEKEYYWDARKQNRGKTNSEYIQDLIEFFGMTPIKSIYIDPSAESFELELKKHGFHAVHARNDVFNGIQTMTNEMKVGNLTICKNCTNLIREIEGYVWDPKESEKGYDEPLKKNDHAVDALRYAIYSHKISTFDVDAYYKKQEMELRQKFHPGGYRGNY